jgi:2-succinyl-6-hydroxy-2,4-cyclohexadiene-1-carboxylate synthase
VRLSRDPARLARTLRAAGLGVMPAFGRALARVTARVDLLVGERDDKFRELARQLVTSLPRVSLELVADAGHNLLLERPEVVARAIAQGAQET